MAAAGEHGTPFHLPLKQNSHWHYAWPSHGMGREEKKEVVGGTLLLYTCIVTTELTVCVA